MANQVRMLQLGHTFTLMIPKKINHYLKRMSYNQKMKWRTQARSQNNLKHLFQTLVLHQIWKRKPTLKYSSICWKRLCGFKSRSWEKLRRGSRMLWLCRTSPWSRRKQEASRKLLIVSLIKLSFYKSVDTSLKQHSTIQEESSKLQDPILKKHQQEMLRVDHTVIAH